MRSCPHSVFNGFIALAVSVACSNVKAPSAAGDAGSSSLDGEAAGSSLPGDGTATPSIEEAGAASGADGSAGEDPIPGEGLFGSEEVLRFEFTLSDEDWTALEERGYEEKYVEAAVSLDNEGLGSPAFGLVGLRHKGNWSLNHCWDDFGGVRSYADICAKLSLKVKFDEYDADQRLDGLKRLNLHAMQMDPTKMHELFAYEIFRGFGVEASRIRPATVSVNGMNLGVFMAVEEVDGRFTKAHFEGSGDGDLYKEVWPDPDLPESAFIDALETNADTTDVSAMLAFASAAGRATLDTFEQDLGPFVDVEHLLRYLAVDRALKNWDGITTFYVGAVTVHNNYWYRDSGGTDKFQLIPWDLDNTMGRDLIMEPLGNLGFTPPPNWNEKPLNCDPRPVIDVSGDTQVTPCRCDAFLDLLARGYWDQYAQLGQELIDERFNVPQLQTQADHWITVLDPLLAEDPFVDIEDWRVVSENWRDETLPQLVSDFETFLAEGLTDEVAVAAPVVTPPSNSVTTDSGFSTSALNGFEFEDGIAGEAPDAASSWTDETSSVAVSWNTTDPIAGAGDLKIDFTFERLPGSYDEFVGVGYYGGVGDIAGKEYLVLSMKANPARSVRIALASPLFEDAYGGAWPEFSVERLIPESGKQLIIPLTEFTYAVWAKDAWEAGQGWTTSDADAFQQVLQNVNGVIFNPAASVDSAGELLAEQETGSLQIDEIYFQ